MSNEHPDPVLFFARLEEVKVKRNKDSQVPEYTARLTAYFDKADLPHLATLQEGLMQVAFTLAPPAGTFSGFEPS
jgi:hypothetical protein